MTVTNSSKFLAKLSMVQYGRELVKSVGQEMDIIDKTKTRDANGF